MLWSCLSWHASALVLFVTFMFLTFFLNNIPRGIQGAERAQFVDLRITSLLFADNLALLAFRSDWSGSQPNVKQQGMRISTSKSETRVLSWKKVRLPSLGFR